MGDIKQIQAELDEAGSAVQAARTLLSQGSLVDLSGLEKFVENLCGSVAELSSSQSGTIKPALVKLIDELNGLAEVIVIERDSISGEMKTLSDNKRAASAYGSSVSSPVKPPKE
ncbi:MAG: hypothetical protein HQ514_16430 [Rhodospirillales bacterium]|nr:hypothetical protein [Rhodospirillales bacterium]